MFPFLVFNISLWLNNGINFYNSFTSHFNDIQLNNLIILAIVVIFITLHYLRTIKILKQLSILLSFFPVLIHELGHAFAAQVTGGYVHEIHMVLTPKQQQRSGTQGFAITSNKNKISEVITIFMGYISAPLMLILSIYLIIHEKSYIFIILCIFFALFYVVHSKQKWIPLILTIVCLYFGYNIYFEGYMIILNSIDIIYSILIGLLLGETIQSIITTFKVHFIERNNTWDGALLKQKTFIPSTFWWLIWSIFSLYAVYYVLVSIL